MYKTGWQIDCIYTKRNRIVHTKNPEFSTKPTIPAHTVFYVQLPEHFQFQTVHPATFRNNSVVDNILYNTANVHSHHASYIGLSDSTVAHVKLFGADSDYRI